MVNKDEYTSIADKFCLYMCGLMLAERCSLGVFHLHDFILYFIICVSHSLRLCNKCSFIHSFIHSCMNGCICVTSVLNFCALLTVTALLYQLYGLQARC